MSAVCSRISNGEGASSVGISALCFPRDRFIRRRAGGPGRAPRYPDDLRRPGPACAPEPVQQRTQGLDGEDRPDISAPEAEVGRRDIRTIFAVQALRALLYGFGSVLIGASLAKAGYSDAKVGLVFTAMLGGFAITSVAVGTRGDRIGRRRLYAGLFLVMAAAGSVFAL